MTLARAADADSHVSNVEVDTIRAIVARETGDKFSGGGQTAHGSRSTAGRELQR